MSSAPTSIVDALYFLQLPGYPIGDSDPAAADADQVKIIGSPVTLPDFMRHALQGAVDILLVHDNNLFHGFSYKKKPSPRLDEGFMFACFVFCTVIISKRGYRFTSHCSQSPAVHSIARPTGSSKKQPGICGRSYTGVFGLDRY